MAYPYPSIIETFEAEFLEQYQNSLLPSQRKALAAMKNCRTASSPQIRTAVLPLVPRC
jgi:hypothetical protein